MRATKSTVPGVIGCNMLKQLKQAMESNTLLQESAVVNHMVNTYNDYLQLCEEMKKLSEKHDVSGHVKIFQPILWLL